ncbi:MAG TPA: hypothetical protein VJN88_01030, partial [Ktedonobacterales bacterium]|nr:hypothetical protein [Ktedonobacterales bacterium]
GETARVAGDDTRLDSGPLAPPPFPVGATDEPLSAAPAAPRPAARQAPKTIPITEPEWEPRPSVARDRWVTQDEVLADSEHAMYGATKPYRVVTKRPLPRPVRFRPVPKWRSWGVLIIATAAILAVLIGAVISSNVGAKLLGPSATPTPTVVHHPTVTPVAKPKK